MTSLIDFSRNNLFVSSPASDMINQFDHHWQLMTELEAQRNSLAQFAVPANIQVSTKPSVDDDDDDEAPDDEDYVVESAPSKRTRARRSKRKQTGVTPPLASENSGDDEDASAEQTEQVPKYGKGSRPNIKNRRFASSIVKVK
jgi:hypothetical protein